VDKKLFFKKYTKNIPFDQKNKILKKEMVLNNKKK